MLHRQHLHCNRLCLQHHLAALHCMRRIRRAALLLRHHVHGHWLGMQHDEEPAGLLFLRRGEPALLRKQQLHCNGLRLQHH